MSAYVVDRPHIAFLVEAAHSRALDPGHYGGISWYHNTHLHTLNYSDHERAAKVGQMLWDENVRSVQHRYPECSDDLPGEIGCDFQYGEHVRPQSPITPVAVLKACDGYEYQACETDDWSESEAHAFLQGLRSRAISMLPGYEDAEWAIT